jgi:hypothetical protein
VPVKGTWYLNTGFLKHHNTSISEKISRLNFFEFGCLLLLFFLLFIRFIYIFTYDTDLEGVEFALVHFVQMIILKGHLMATQLNSLICWWYMHLCIIMRWRQL